MANTTLTYRLLKSVSKSDPRIENMGTAPAELVEKTSVQFEDESHVVNPDRLAQAADEVAEMEPVGVTSPERTAARLRRMANRLYDISRVNAVAAYNSGYDSCDYRATGSGRGSSRADYMEDANAEFIRRAERGKIEDLPDEDDPRRIYHRKGWLDAAARRGRKYGPL